MIRVVIWFMSVVSMNKSTGPVYTTHKLFLENANTTLIVHLEK